MSYAGHTRSSGSSSGSVNSLTPDTGGIVTPVGGNIDVLGFPADTVQTMETYKTSDGVLQIADQTWQTQYVVDASTTDGLKGTFTTIQAAIDQAFADGAVSNAIRKIFIRPGTYVEDLSFPAGCGIVLEGDSLSSTSFLGLVPDEYVTIIQGTHESGLGSNIIFRRISLQNNGNTQIFDDGILSSLCLFQECTIFSIASSASMMTLGPSTSRFAFTDCTIPGGITPPAYDIIISDGVTAFFANCDFGSVPPLNGGYSTTSFQKLGSGDLYFDNCIGISSIDLDGTGVLECFDSTFLNGASNNYDYFISGTGSGGYLSDCDFGSDDVISVFPTSGAAIQDTTGPWTISGLTSFGGIIYEDDTSITEGQSTQGDVIQVTTTATSLIVDVNDYYIGVTDTSSSRTITLPDPATITNGKVFYIKDESGAASGNNIIIDTAAGNIDGASSVSISTNYGCIQAVKRGSNYFII